MSATIQSTMIRASAGSGKTYQLANRFLALMALGVAPEKIIALTFTRKAAGEFTGRIMTRLATGAADDQGATELSAQLMEIISGTEVIPALVRGQTAALPIMDKAFFQEKLEELIHALDRLALSTLDSYFVRIVRNFSLELGLSGFDLMEDTTISAQRISVMGTIFSKQRTRKSEREAFLQSFKQATWGEEENRLCQTLENFISEHQSRWLTAPDINRWGGEDLLWPQGCPYPKGDVPKLAGQLRRLLGEPYSPHKTYMNGWIKVCDLLEAYVPGVPVKANAQLTRAIPLWDQYAQGGIVGEKNKYEISSEMGTLMTTLLGAYIRSEIEVRLKRTQGLYAVISAYEQYYHEHVRSRGRLCFSDLTLLLAGEGAMKIWDDNAKDLIDYRLDARYDHWLLDEFQDTSQPQWQAVSNLIDEIIQDPDGQRSVFVVGDSKQSIYGWRGGEPKLFDDLKTHYGERLAEWDMDRSYRSSQHVLELVNAVCDLSAPKWRDLFPEAAIDRWVYHRHEPDKAKSGHALVLETLVDPKEADSDDKTAARYRLMQSLLQQIDPLAHGKTCAVLVSKNAQVTDIVDFLRRELPDMPVASESETVLADGPEGAVILDLFRWLNNPDHSFGYIHVTLSPLGPIIAELTGTSSQQEQWSLLTEKIACHGVESLVCKLVSDLSNAVELSEYGRSRLDAVTSAAADFSVQGGSLQEWIMMLEMRSLHETIREGVIQVMTVHKCKGLGFDVVILPELGSHKEFTDAGRLQAIERKGHLGKIEYVIKKPTKDICDADFSLRAMMEAWEANQCYERFCNLYVALTRAKHATYCILDPVKDDWSAKKKYDDWIREATSSYPPDDLVLGSDHCRILYQSGTWLDLAVEESTQASEASDTLPVLPGPVPRISRKIASQAKKRQVGDLLQQSKAMRFGNWVHAQFEQVSWLDALPEFDVQPAARLVKECLDSESIKPYFERPEGEHVLLREQPFETRLEGSWVSGVIDRAVIFKRDGKPDRIQIIDFKTDRDKTAGQLRDLYQQQLGVYRAAMAEITGVSEKKVTCLLLSTALKEMIEV